MIKELRKLSKWFNENSLQKYAQHINKFATNIKDLLATYPEYEVEIRLASNYGVKDENLPDIVHYLESTDFGIKKIISYVLKEQNNPDVVKTKIYTKVQDWMDDDRDIDWDKRIGFNNKVVNNPKTSEEVIQAIFANNDGVFLTQLARGTKSPTVLNSLFTFIASNFIFGDEAETGYNLCALIAGNRATPDFVLTKIFKYTKSIDDTLTKIMNGQAQTVESNEIDKEDLDQVRKHYKDVVEALMSNPKCPPDILKIIKPETDIDYN